MSTSKIYDISLPISESLAVWPGDPSVRIERVSDLAEGDEATVSRLQMGAHTGTHVDAPAHFLPGGSGVDALDLDILVGRALVVDALEASALDAKTLNDLVIPEGCERLLFHTRNSRQWETDPSHFDKGFVAITEDGAAWLTTRGISLIGTDALSVAPFRHSVPTHRQLLSAGVLVVEGLDLTGVPAGEYELICLPLKLVGADGAPARAVLIDR